MNNHMHIFQRLTHIPELFLVFSSILSILLAVATQCFVCFCLCFRAEFLLKTDSGYPRDAGVFFSFTMRNPWSSLHLNTHWSAPTVSALARSGGPRKMSQPPVLFCFLAYIVISRFRESQSNCEQCQDFEVKIVGILRML